MFQHGAIFEITDLIVCLSIFSVSYYNLDINFVLISIFILGFNVTSFYQYADPQNFKEITIASLLSILINSVAYYSFLVFFLLSKNEVLKRKMSYVLLSISFVSYLSKGWWLAAVPIPKIMYVFFTQYKLPKITLLITKMLIFLIYAIYSALLTSRYKLMLSENMVAPKEIFILAFMVFAFRNNKDALHCIKYF